MPKQTYLNSDSSYEIIYKNKDNIIDLYAELNKLKGSSDATIEDLEKLLGNYSQDITGELDTSKSVIENLSIVASNLTSALNRISANESAINRILNDGIGNYIGTYQATDNNDKSNLPFPSADKDRAITEYVTGDTYKYQEWQFNNGNDDSWSKKGMELDSHIHSQSGGITLDDVANLQDPKIAKVDAKTTWTFIDEDQFKSLLEDNLKQQMRINIVFKSSSTQNSGTYYLSNISRILFNTKANYTLWFGNYTDAISVGLTTSGLYNVSWFVDNKVQSDDSISEYNIEILDIKGLV